jgi:eukaryotic-like serine/threonine-protein kinase
MNLPGMPERIGRYAVLGLLGSGGMARVYLGRTVGPGRFERLAAIKMLHRDLSMNEQFVGMLLDEAWIAARIQHPNVVSVHEVDRHASQYYLAMDYVCGEGLDRVHVQLRDRGRRMPFDLTAYIGMEIAEALHAVHDVRDPNGNRLNVVHRDVTPQNMMIGYDGTVRLMDFGVAKASDRIQQTTNPGLLKGKVGYLAPEQMTMRPVDHRADIFSLGIVLWETAVGRRLFHNNLAAAMHMIMTDAVPRPSVLAPEVPPELDSIIMQALKPDPDERIQSARELGQRLRRMLIERRQYPSAADLETFVRALFPHRFEKLDSIVRRAAALDLTNERPDDIIQRLWNDMSNLVDDLDDDEPTHTERRTASSEERWDGEKTVSDPAKNEQK